MTDLPIALTCADYARVMPLATGVVKPRGIALTMLLGSRGSWPARADMLRRAVQDPEVQGGEWSMAQYLYRIARSLTEAFVAGNDAFTEAQKGFPYATPWLEAELEDVAAVMGEDVHPCGYEANRVQIEMFAGEAFRLGLTSRRVTPEEYFADFLAS